MKTLKKLGNILIGTSPIVICVIALLICRDCHAASISTNLPSTPPTMSSGSPQVMTVPTVSTKREVELAENIHIEHQILEKMNARRADLVANNEKAQRAMLDKIAAGKRSKRDMEDLQEKQEAKVAVKDDEITACQERIRILEQARRINETVKAREEKLVNEALSSNNASLREIMQQSANVSVIEMMKNHAELVQKNYDDALKPWAATTQKDQNRVTPNN